MQLKGAPAILRLPPMRKTHLTFVHVDVVDMVFGVLDPRYCYMGRGNLNSENAVIILAHRQVCEGIFFIA